jgi:hypothetical protein
MGPVGALVMLSLVVGVVLLVAYAQRRARNAAQGQGFAGGIPQFDPYAQQRGMQALAVLQARDPALTEQSIVERVRPMADQLRGAWCAGDMRPARAFVSDGVYSRFQVQLALMRQENRRNVMGEAAVMNVGIEAVEDAPPLDVLHVRLTAQARDTEVPWTANDQQIQQQLARTPVTPYQEIWSLVRRTGAVTKPGAPPPGQACPSCGAPLAGGETIKCRYCGSLVCSGEFDWVLAEITQVEEWRPTDARPPGIDALRAVDPGTAAEVLEDRASFLFWKWVEAGRAGNPAPLRKHATPALLAGGARWDLSQGASDVAVGGSQLVQCTGGGADGLDHVDVLILWSARFGGSRDYTPRRVIMRMARRAGVQSRLSMTALTCAQCGAPLTESDNSKCDHCGAELADGNQAWVLEAVVPG